MHDDIIFLHPPSIFDFRERPILWGPMNDLVPSKSVFEMYPIGFVSLASALEENGFNVRIVNIALRMLQDSSFSPREYLSKMNAKAFAIDLHWLPHVHGAVELARTCKEVHPDVPVITGGLSASYYHEEILRDLDSFDFVLRGDSVEFPLVDLMKSLTGGGEYEAVSNLSYRRGGEVVVNELSAVPGDIDSFSLDYDLVYRNVLKYKNLDILPFYEFLSRPIMAVLTRKGCDNNCAGCGGSSFSYSTICNRNRVGLRSPDRVVEDILKVQEYRSPAFIIGDLGSPDEEYGREILSSLADKNISIPIIFEFFNPPTPDFLQAIGDAVDDFSVEMSPESGVEEIRNKTGRKYSNHELEEAIAGGLEAGSNQFDLYFMIGLRDQDRDSVRTTIDYASSLLEEYPDGYLMPFISPYSPFLDPGSLGFEYPELYGYEKYAETLTDHYNLLANGVTWKDFLSYRTNRLSKSDIVDLSYSAGIEFARMKKRAGIISDRKLKEIEDKIHVSREMISLAEKGGDGGTEQLKASLNELDDRLTIDRGELDWANAFSPRRLAAVLSKGAKIYGKTIKDSKFYSRVTSLLHLFS